MYIVYCIYIYIYTLYMHIVQYTLYILHINYTIYILYNIHDTYIHTYEFLICNVFVIMIYADYYLYIDCIIIRAIFGYKV